MSTDYGLVCECGATWITDNIRENDVEDFIRDIHELAKLHEVMTAIRTDIYLSTHFSNSNDLAGLLKFAHTHHMHKMSIVDEYRYHEIEDHV
ncbi:MAG: hypothetical protein HY865_00965 [Chloroflexi bacterium]|nr:hypothetical protein [Chloroflexota bacterium]